MSNNFVSNGIIENGKVRNSQITTSSIDMNDSIITSHIDPINYKDVSNKGYVDKKVKVFNITLSGTNTTDIILPPYSTNIYSGNLIINIVNISTPDGPNATFNITKSNQNNIGAIHRTSTSAGTTTLERLMVIWPANSTPKVYKTGLNYDGVYQVFIIPNFTLLSGIY